MPCGSYIASNDISVVEEGIGKKPPAGEDMICVEGERAWFTLASVGCAFPLDVGN